mgnify:FL=1
MKADYSPEELASAHVRYRTLCEAVASCPLQSVRDLWESAVINGLDTCDDLSKLRKEWNMPNLTGMDVEAIISMSSICGLVTERFVCTRVHTWFRNHGFDG